MPPRAPLLLRKERGWNTFDRWLRKHPLIQRLHRLARSSLLWQVVRRKEGNHAGGALMVQTAGGGGTGGAGSDYTDLNADAPCIEQQGVASGVGAGARGLVAPNIGGVPGEAACIGMRKLSHRPTVLDDWDICLYHVAGSRTWLKDNGELRLETGLADYKESPDDLDEGAKLRLARAGVKGDVELYGENEVIQRAQPAGEGEGARASTKLEAIGQATFEVSNGAGVTATITMLDGAITVENHLGSKIELKANGDVDVVAFGNLEIQGVQIKVGSGATLAAARSTDPVNPGVALGVWAQTVETACNVAAPGSFTPANSFATTVAAPPNSGNFGVIGTGSASVKVK